HTRPNRHYSFRRRPTPETYPLSLHDALPISQFAKRNSQVVGDHEHLANRNFKRAEPVLYRFAAQVHVSGRLYERKTAALGFYFGYKRMPAGFKRSIVFFCQVVEHHKANVVARICVFGADVAEAYDQVFQIGGFRGGRFFFRLKDVEKTFKHFRSGWLSNDTKLRFVSETAA